MPSTLSVHAVDRSTYVVTAAFTDEDGTAVVPTSIIWTLSARGVVVNGREDVSVTPPASTIEIVLKGDDLAFADHKFRQVTIFAVYDSTLGTGLPLRDQVSFEIDDLQMVT